MTALGEVITIGATEHTGCWVGNTHRIIVKEETAEHFVGWPDPTDPRNSENWKPGIDKPMLYPKFAWERYEEPKPFTDPRSRAFRESCNHILKSIGF